MLQLLGGTGELKGGRRRQKIVAEPGVTRACGLHMSLGQTEKRSKIILGSIKVAMVETLFAGW